MPMAPEDDEIVGGTVLRIPAIQSPNYVAGASGWIINADGTVEFTAGTFRGSIEVGPLTGQHFIVNNPATGDALDIYNSSNQLVFSINAFGIATSHNPTTGLESSLQAGQIQLDNSPGLVNANLVLVPSGNVAIRDILEIIMSPHLGTSYTLSLEGGSDNGALSPTLVGNEHNISGSMVQSDQIATNNLMHVGHYSGTVAGGNGVWTFAHGCSFTPAEVIMTPWDSAGAQSRNYPVLGSTTISGGNCSAQWWDGVGNKVANGVTVGVRAVFFG